jgi:hypothetical protein
MGPRSKVSRPARAEQVRAHERHPRRPGLLACALLFNALLLASACIASEPASPAAGSQSNFVSQFFSDWLERAEHARATEPQWVSPLVTVTPRLEQNLLRFDQSWQELPRGVEQSVSGPKIKLIPSESFEVDLGAPSYMARSSYDRKHRWQDVDNWGDASFLVKYRLLSADEAGGNYIVTFFTGVTVPTGSKSFGTGSTVFSPTIAMGKGWGNFDIQSTLGVSVSDRGMDRLGTPLSFNTALQYCVRAKIWPELEFNYAWWPNGQKTGENSLSLTPGILFGRFPIWRTLNYTVGTGVQVAVTRHRSSDLNWILSARLAF